MEMSFNTALCTLYRQESLTLSYKQCIDVCNIDVDYAPYVVCHTETLRIQFPKECVLVRRFRSSHPCKIVTYRMLGMMREKEVHPDTEIMVEPDTVCLVYTRSKKDFVLWFDAVLTKRVLVPLTAAL